MHTALDTTRTPLPVFTHKIILFSFFRPAVYLSQKTCSSTQQQAEVLHWFCSKPRFYLVQWAVAANSDCRGKAATLANLNKVFMNDWTGRKTHVKQYYLSLKGEVCWKWSENFFQSFFLCGVTQFIIVISSVYETLLLLSSLQLSSSADELQPAAHWPWTQG